MLNKEETKNELQQVDMTFWNLRIKMDSFNCSFVKLLCCCFMLTCTAQQTVINYSISEASVPQVLGNIISDDPTLILPSTQDNDIYFSIIDLQSGYHSFFTVDTNGDFRTVSVIDRDEICPQFELCRINLDIQVMPIQYFQIVKVAVTIIDINDEAPQFAESIYTVSVSEAVPISTPVILPTATDKDSPENGIVSYKTSSLDASSFLFQDIDVNNPEPRVVTNKLLDRESVSSYQFLLYAMDNNSPTAKSGSTLVRITLLDVNDRAPEFTQSVYEVTVDENLAVNSSILQVTANDKDTDLNARVLYFFNDVTLTTYNSLFSIDETTGVIRVHALLDYESLKEATLTVIARNNELTSPSSQARVIVRVRDKNDEPPIIQIKTENINGHIYILENATLETFLAHITVQDLDTGKGGEFSCQVEQEKPQEQEPHFQLLQIHSNDFKLATKRTFDRELQEEYVISVNCIDKADNPLSSSEVIVISINDVNDNNPQFDSLLYKAEIIENSLSASGQEGEVLLKVHAQDRDIEENGRITYSISNSINSLTVLKHIDLNPTNGDIKVIYPFNYEHMKSLSFNVTATDQGSIPRSSECTVEIQVKDTDDEGPVFTQNIYNIEALENNEIGDAIGQVEASDFDSNNFNSIAYYLMNEAYFGSQSSSNEFNITDNVMAFNESFNNFTIDVTSGIIYATFSLDRENVSNFTLYVIAIGPAPLYRSSTCVALVTVLDKNDNSPVITFPSTDNQSVSVPTYLYAADVIAHIKAYDMDVNENSLLNYHIVSGDDNSLLEIDSDTGIISTTRSYSASYDEEIELLLLVSDSGVTRNSNSAILRIVFNLAPQAVEQSSDKNQNIVIVIGVLSGIIVVALIIAILCILRRKQNDPKQHQHTPLKTVSGNVPVNAKVSEIHTASDLYSAFQRQNYKNLDLLDDVQKIGVVNKGIDLADLDEDLQRKASFQEQYNEEVAPNNAVKDSSSEGSHDSGRGSNDENNSLSASLQRWQNVPLSLSKNHTEVNIDEQIQLDLDKPHPDPEGLRPQKSQSFRSDSTMAPPELPPRTKRVSYSFRTSNEMPPPVPPPKIYNIKDTAHHFSPQNLFYSPNSALASSKSFNYDLDPQNQYKNLSSSVMQPSYALYDRPKYLYSQSDDVKQYRQENNPFPAIIPHVHTEENVDFIDHNSDLSNRGPLKSSSTETSVRFNNKHSGSNGTFDSRYNPTVFNDDIMLLEDDVFSQKNIPQRSKYCSQV